ncbi:hypothetical protein DUNSADRAFT_8772 [Dunaliella salina]|uniref:Selenoprotein T n=1 Tax=Dunaliella salina TaxID=3046 RepID=A0ABQ7GIT9_DUNSA|nr:hypothetical protein DUNSADRAFT_8772 [Dunaliella salina]|eukprot:KAF5834521.1 hypothetical protein DUNSADRAFT_8772 [Dunaliella salina]
MEKRYPQLEVQASTYPPPPLQALLAKALGYAQVALIAFVVLGEKAFEFCGMPTPLWYTQNVANQRLVAGIMVWFVGNMIFNGLTQTGAFEIYSNDQLVFSKLATGRFPSIQELADGLQRTLE